jgi:hypothetical protein
MIINNKALVQAYKELNTTHSSIAFLLAVNEAKVEHFKLYPNDITSKQFYMDTEAQTGKSAAIIKNKLREYEELSNIIVLMGTNPGEHRLANRLDLLKNMLPLDSKTQELILNASAVQSFPDTADLIIAHCKKEKVIVPGKKGRRTKIITNTSPIPIMPFKEPMKLAEANKQTLSNEQLILEGARLCNEISCRRLIGDGKDEARGTDKLIPIHGAINRTLRSAINPNFHIVSLGEQFAISPTEAFQDGNELTISGFYNPKRVDIAIANRIIKTKTTSTGRKGKELYEYEPIAAVFSKLLFANVSQNVGNYFDGMRGETSNVRKQKRPVGQIVLIKNRPKYFTKDKTIQREETFDKKYLERYIKLHSEDPDQEMERPNAMYVVILDEDDDGKLSKTSLQDLGFDAIKDKEMIEQYLKMSDYEIFLQEFSTSVK